MAIVHGQSLLRLIAVLFISTMIFSCGSSENSLQTGSVIAFQLKWPVAKSVGSAPVGVSTVRMSVAGPGMSTISKDFAASAGTGSIDNVPVGNDRSITFQGLDTGSTIIYQSTLTNVTLVQGQTYNCGTVTMAAVVDSTTVPAPPTGLSATAVSSSQIKLDWVDNTNNETGYKIERKTGSSGTYAQIGTVAANVTTFNDTTLSASTLYYYRVRATNNVGDSGYGNEANAVTPANSYSITGRISSGGSVLAGVTVTLSGNGSAATTSDSSGNFSFNGVRAGSYTLTPGMAGYVFTPATLAATITGANLSAMNFLATASTVPEAPSGLGATAAPINRINLVWVDNANNETGYSVERKTGSSGTYAPIGTVAANVTTYSDSSLSASTTYYYRVRATNGVGNSGYTAEASAATYELATLVTPALVKVTGGSFTMGDTYGEGNSNELPTHLVTVGDFYIGAYEVTQGEWRAVMGSNPSYFSACGADCPVEQVSWNDIQIFITTLNQLSGKSYRLPTEAEWEYAARSGGQSQKFSGGSDINTTAWYSVNAANATHPVGLKLGNGLGSFDMSGNVWEWVSDWYGPYSSSAQTNPTGPLSGLNRVIRGGGWSSADALSVRTTSRLFGSTVLKTNYIGFRLATSVP